MYYVLIDSMTFSAIPIRFCYNDFVCYTIVFSTLSEFYWNLQNLFKMGEEISEILISVLKKLMKKSGNPACYVSDFQTSSITTSFKPSALLWELALPGELLKPLFYQLMFQ